MKSFFSRLLAAIMCVSLLLQQFAAAQVAIDPGARGAAQSARSTAVTAAVAQRLASLARTARNPHTSAPWKVPAAWAQSTAYAQGEVVLANAYWWVAQSGGTSSSTGAGPSNVDSRNVTVDGTVQWLLLGAPTALTDDAQAPTVTRSSSVPSAPANLAWVYATDSVRLYGGKQLSTLSDRWRTVTFNRSASSTERGSGGRIAFWSDAATLTLLTDAISGGSEGPLRVVVDGRYLTPSGFSNSNVTTYTTISWATRKPRLYEIEGWSREGYFSSLRAIYVAPTDLIWKPDTGNDFRAYWISDSQSASHSFGPFAPGGGIPQRVARLMGWNDVWNASIGGTGYINPGAGPFYTFAERVAEGLTRNPDAWVFYGSTNDNGQAPSAITAAALATYQAVRNGGSKAPIFVVGVEPVNASSSVTETAIQAAVTQFNDPQTFFIPLANATPNPVIIGSYNRPASVPSTTDTWSRDVNSTDGIHLMENVMQKHAEFISNGIRAAIDAMLRRVAANDNAREALAA